MAQITRPNSYAANTTIKSSEVNDDLDTIYNEFNGNIDNNNIKAAAAITNTKISGTAIISNPTDNQLITAATAAKKPLELQELASQTAAPFGILDSTGTKVFEFSTATSSKRLLRFGSQTNTNYVGQSGNNLVFRDANLGAEYNLQQLISSGVASNADTDVKGITYLSTSPTSASVPIAVGTNDGRMFTTAYYRTRTEAFATATPNTTATITNLNLLVSSPGYNANPYHTHNNIKFGGDGSDGALNVTSGTTTLDAASANVLIKQYSSLNISAGATLTISNPGTGGTVLYLKVRGDVTIAGKIDLKGFGGAGGAAVNPGVAGYGILDDSNHYGVNGTSGSGSTPGTAGSAGAAYLTQSFYTPLYGSIIRRAIYVWCGSGGGGGGNGNGRPGGVGGAGGGALIIECGGSFNFVAGGEIDISGANGSNGSDGGPGNAGGGGGGGGAVGSALIIYNTLTADAGTKTATGGNGGAGGNQPQAGTGASGASGGGGGCKSIAGAGRDGVLNANGLNGNNGTNGAGGGGGSGASQSAGNTGGAGGTGGALATAFLVVQNTIYA